MTHIPDLAPCTYFDAVSMFWIAGRFVPASVFAGRLVAVGWLDLPHAVPTGPVTSAVRAQLEAFVAAQGNEGLPFRGVHTCSYCEATIPGGLPPREWFQRLRGSRSGAILFIPTAEGPVFLAPALVLHYIDVHGYQPPASFCTAVLACPPFGSAPYFAWLEGSHQSTDGSTPVR